MNGLVIAGDSSKMGNRMGCGDGLWCGFIRTGYVSFGSLLRCGFGYTYSDRMQLSSAVERGMQGGGKRWEGKSFAHDWLGRYRK